MVAYGHGAPAIMVTFQAGSRLKGDKIESAGHLSWLHFLKDFYRKPFLVTSDYLCLPISAREFGKFNFLAKFSRIRYYSQYRSSVDEDKKNRFGVSSGVLN